MISFHTCPLAALGGKKTGGMNVYVREVGRQLAIRGTGVDVFTRSQNPKIDRVVPLGHGARVIHIPAGPEAPCEKDQGWLYLPEFGRGVLDFVRAEKIHYDIIHSHYWLSGWTGLRLCRDLGVPLVHMFHTLGVMKNMVAKDQKEKETTLRILLEKRLMDLSPLVVASNPADRAHMVWYYGADPTKIEVVPCGVDLNLFNPLPQDNAKGHLGLSDRRVILFVGRIQPIKGLDCLLKALGILIEKSRISSKDLRLLIIGGDLDNGVPASNGEIKKLQSLTTELGLDSIVNFLGAQPQHVLPYFYSAAEVCVLPSRYESFGMVALESMACGTPVIASRVGGLSYTIRDGQTGYLIPEGNAVALADRIDRLLQDKSLRSLMGRQGANHAKKYSWENVAHQLISLYNRILSQTYPETLDMNSSAPSIAGREMRSCSGSSSCGI
jgi:D-inositol-3-phosphate glycosyltransferase